MLDMMARPAEIVSGEADWDGHFELGPEHMPGAPWYALQLKVPGHKGRVRVCATLVGERRSAPPAAAPPPPVMCARRSGGPPLPPAEMRGPQLTPNGLGPGWSLSQPPPAR